jgi:hypothetical protein
MSPDACPVEALSLERPQHSQDMWQDIMHCSVGINAGPDPGALWKRTYYRIVEFRADLNTTTNPQVVSYHCTFRSTGLLVNQLVTFLHYVGKASDYLLEAGNGMGLPSCIVS